MAQKTKKPTRHTTRKQPVNRVDRWRPVLRSVWKWFGIPALLYLAIFFLTQPHFITDFSDAFYLDSGDGFQNVWNIWWVNESLAEHGNNPYFTTTLHWPHGTTLLPQTMNIINGLIAVPLINIFGFSLVEATNFAVVSAYVLGGVTMFWFIQKLYGKYWVSLVAGGLFTFSTYHMAHGQGHMQLITLQFIPLFMLAFWTLVEKVRYRYAVLAAGALFLVLLSDYYYLFWSVLLGAMWFGWKLYRKEFKLTKQSIKVMALFALLCAVLIGPMVFNLTQLNKHDPLTGSHDPMVFVLDPLSVLVPGGSWYWSSLTDWHWLHLPFAAETSVFFGAGLLTLLGIAFYKTFIVRLRKQKPDMPVDMYFWWIVMVVFGLLALGPRLRVAGHTLDRVPMPYHFMEMIFPTLKISGMPVRWILMSLIAAIVIGAYILTKVNLKTTKGLVLLGVFLSVSIFDLWPAPLPLESPVNHTQPYVEALKLLPPGAVIDNGAESGGQQLFHQTVHEKPMAFGYVTRLPRSADEKDFHIFAALEEGRYDQLCKTYKIRYVTTPIYRTYGTNYPIVYRDKDTLIYDFKNSDNC